MSLLALPEELRPSELLRAACEVMAFAALVAPNGQEKKNKQKTRKRNRIYLSSHFHWRNLL